MKIFISTIFLFSLFSMFIVYPIYFFFLNEFRKKVSMEHEDAWKEISGGVHGHGLRAAYRALQLSRKGNIRGISLSSEIIMIRKKAVAALYIGMLLFIVVLTIGLFEAVSVGKY